MNNLNRRSFLSVAALGVAMTTLAACGAKNEAPGAGSAGAYVAPPKDTTATLTYAIWAASQKPAMEKIVEMFNKEYPNIKINIDVTPSKGSAYWTKIQTMASSNTLPDVFWMNGPRIKLYAQNKQLLPLDGLVDAKAVETANYPKALVDLYTVDGTFYGVPKDFDTIALFYRPSMLKAAGVPEPTADWTWDDVLANGDKLAKFYKDKGIYGFAGDVAGGQASYYNTIFSAGGYVISPDGKKSGYDSPEAIEGLQFWRDTIESGMSPNMQQLTETYPSDFFRSGKIAMVMDASYEAGATFEALGEDVKVAPLPKGPASSTSVIHGLANVIPANAKNPDAARAFVAFLSTKESALAQASNGTVIPAFNGTQQAWVDAMPTMGAGVFLEAAKTAMPYPVSKNTSAWSSLEEEFLPKAFAGTMPVADAAKQLAAKMNDVLSKDS